MRDLTIGKYRRIRKDVARRLFNNGRIIYLTPSKVAPNDSGPWIRPYAINNRAGQDFDAIVNSFEFYNCCYELGYYTSFWVNREEK
jgi:hypothetical protein